MDKRDVVNTNKFLGAFTRRGSGGWDGLLGKEAVPFILFGVCRRKRGMKRREAPGVRGARNEIICVLDLLRQGFTVYRNVAAHGVVDLLAWKRGRVIKIQVKSEVGRHGLRRNDVLAVVTSDGLLRYRVRNRKIARLFEESRVVRSISPAKTRVVGKKA